MAKIVVVGEAMLEMIGGPKTWQLGFAGDVLNTAIHLTRSHHLVRLLTAVGTDPFSRQMRSDWEQVGIDTSLVLSNPTRHPGLYAVLLDRDGERNFTYWRDNSAARTMLDLPGSPAAIAEAQDCDLLYFSLITLAILPEQGRNDLLGLARRVRLDGGQVAFDSNYRPALWQTPSQAREVRDEAIAVASIGLPTLADEVLLEGSATSSAVRDHWSRLGCHCVVVKLGKGGCELPSGIRVPPEMAIDPVDTSGAGDAFNAGFLSAILQGRALDVSAAEANELAGWTIQHKGAIPPARPQT